MSIRLLSLPGALRVAIVGWLVLAASARADVPRWTAETPDEMIDVLAARARAGGDDGLAALAVIEVLDERASRGHARQVLESVAGSSSPLSEEARFLARQLVPAPAPTWHAPDKLVYDTPPDPDGLVTSLAVLGPFRDADGGGLARHEGPEASGQSWFDPRARYAWGAIDVTWRRVLPESVTARGVPLDLYLWPRVETCSYVASRVELADTTPKLVHVAASGAVRVIWDGVDVAASDEVQRSAKLDRLAVRIEPAAAGSHLVAVKVCSSTIADAGRVRLRVTDEAGRPTPVKTSSALAPMTLPDPPRSFTAVDTPLARALAVGTSPSPARALVAAILRVSGGAESVRSPRAPGLLDVVVSAPGVTPDELALAGWLSSAKANSSSWLQLAATRAQDAHDAATFAFAQRRLIARRIELDNANWAASSFEEAPIAAATDSEAILLRARTEEMLRLNKVAYLRMRAVDATHPDRTPITALDELIDLTTSDTERATLARRLAATEVGGRDERYVRAMRAIDRASFEQAAKEALLTATDPTTLTNIADMLLAAGSTDLAREAYRLAQQIAPNRTRAYVGHAAVATATGTSPDDAVVRDDMRRARDLAPQSPWIGGLIALRDPSPKPTNDERFLVSPEVFLQRARAQPAVRGEVTSRTLHWMRVVTYRDDHRVSELVHHAREIIVAPRDRSDLEVTVGGTRTELVIARIHRPSGEVVEPDARGIDKDGKPYVRWPSLASGDIVEIATRTWSRGPVGRRGDPPYLFVDYVGSLRSAPILHNEVIIDEPSTKPFAIDVVNGKPDVLENTTEGDRLITHYVWNAPPTVPDEPFSPPWDTLIPVVAGSTFATWADFLTWYRAAVKGFTEPDDQIRRLAAELTRGKTTREAKLAALFNFVADDIRYENYTSAEWWLPNRPQELLARRQGDCDDKAILLITLLRAIGIDATEVLVHTRGLGKPALLHARNAAIPYFDHGIAYLPGPKGKPGIWLDATSQHSRMGVLPSMDARTWALFADEGPAEIRATPASSPREHGIDRTWAITLEPTGAATIAATERATGDAAFYWRDDLEQPDARRTWVENHVSSPGTEVVGAVDFTSDPVTGVAKLAFTARAPHLARRDGGDLVFSLATDEPKSTQLASLPTRTLPVVLPSTSAPLHDDRTITIEIPSGYRTAELPPDGEAAGGEFGNASITFALRGRKVVIERRFAIDLDVIPVARYAAWRAWLQQVDAIMRRTIRFVPDGGGK